MKGGPDWPQFYGGPTHNNFRAHENAIRFPCLLWHVAGASGQPTIRDGRLYAGGDGLHCIDPEQGAATRARVFDMLASERVAVAAYHMPFPSLGYIERLGTSGYRWLPHSYQLNL